MRVAGVAAVFTVGMRVGVAVGVTENLPVIVGRRSHDPILRMSQRGAQHGSVTCEGLLGNLTLPVPELIDGAASDCHDDNGM